MRTYKAKKAIYQKIEDVEELCRLCLEKTQEGVPIFKDDQNVCAAVAMRIMICVGLDMKRDASLPNLICKTCHEELERYYKFRRKCEISYHKLKYHIFATKLGPETDMSSENHSLQRTEVVPPSNEMAEEGSQGAQITKEIETDDRKQLIIEFSRTSSDVIEKVTEEPVEMDEVQIPLQAEINPDIGTFLSGILTELGILSRQDGGLKLQQGISSFELETGDGEQMTLELMEESDEHSFNIFEDKLPQKCELKEEPVVIDDKPNTESNKLKGGKTSRPWCSICGRAFSSRSASVRHARVHSGARPYACHCGATFAQKSVLQRHMLVHLDVRPHQCPECSKSFTQRASLSQHMRAHAPPPARPLALHRCTICDKVFLHTSGLSRHMFTHAGRLYECSACNKQFKDKSSLVRHLKNYHKGHATNTPTNNVVGNHVAIESVNGNHIVTENVPGNNIIHVENISNKVYKDSGVDEGGTVLMKDEVG